MSRRTRAGGLGLLLAVTAGQVRAQPAASPEAYRHLQVGYDRFQAGDYTAAVAAFERAYALSPEPRFLLNIAVSLATAGGRCPDALAAFERFATVCDACPERDDGRARWAEVRQSCEAPIEVAGVPGARITVDGQARGLAPLSVVLVEGPHIVGATWPDGRATQRSVVVVGGQPQRIELTPPPAARPVARAQPTWPAWTALGIGAAGTGAAAWFGGLLLADLDAEQTTVGREAVQAVRADARTHAIAAQVALGVGLAGLVTGWWLWPESGPEMAGHLTIDAAGVRVRW